MITSQAYKPIFSNVCMFFITTFVVLFSAQARFDFSKNSQNQWSASTKIQGKEGLGQILRELGVEPNWQDRSWIQNIRNENPNLINSKGDILHSGNDLQIPINGLSMCAGYPELVGRMEQTTPQPEPKTPPTQIQAPPATTEPAIKDAEVPMVTEDPSAPIRFSAQVWLGAGLGLLSGMDNTNTSADLSSEFYGAAGARIFAHWNNITNFEFYGRGSYLKYSQPNNISLTSDNDFLYTFGGEVNFRMGLPYRLGLFIEGRSVNRADFKLTSLNIVNSNLLVAGLGASLRLINWENQGFFLKLRPHYLGSGDAGGAKINSGFGLQTQFELSPHQIAGSSGWLFGAEHLYEAQDVKSSIGNTSKQQAHKVLIYLGYKF